jgi:hypothetical protein
MKYRIFVLFLLIFFQTLPVFAHATEPRLEINIDRIIPGGVIDVRGVGFDYEAVITLTLIGSQGEVALGEIAADTEGVFLKIVTLPSDLPEGTYYFRGVSPHHYTLSPALTVQGNAIPAESEEERWDEEDYLPYAIPTYPPGVIPGVVMTPTVTGAPLEISPSSSRSSTNLLYLAGLMVVAVFMVFTFLRRKS